MANSPLTKQNLFLHSLIHHQRFGPTPISVREWLQTVPSDPLAISLWQMSPFAHAEPSRPSLFHWAATPEWVRQAVWVVLEVLTAEDFAAGNLDWEDRKEGARSTCSSSECRGQEIESCRSGEMQEAQRGTLCPFGNRFKFPAASTWNTLLNPQTPVEDGNNSTPPHTEGLEELEEALELSVTPTSQPTWSEVSSPY